MIENDLRRFYSFDRVNNQLTETYYERARIKQKRDKKREISKNNNSTYMCK